MEIIDYGKLKANPSGTTNSIRLAPCADAFPCIDRLRLVEIEPEDVLQSVTINGTVYPIEDGPLLTDDEAVKAIILALLQQYEFDIYLTVVYTPADGDGEEAVVESLVIEHIGQAVLSAINEEFTFARECDRIQVCTFTGTVTDEVYELYVNEADQAIGLGDGSFANAAELEDAIVAALETAVTQEGIYYFSVQVTEVGEDFAVTIVASASTIRIDDIWLLQSNCEQQFEPEPGEGDGESEGDGEPDGDGESDGEG